MSGIVLFRIDERLIHGQVVTAWVGHTKAKQILVIDDKAANDSLMGSILKMAAPPGITVKVATVADGVKILTQAAADDRIIVIVKNPVEAKRVLSAGLDNPPAEINMGNAGMAPGRVKLSPSVYLDAEGVAALKDIVAAGRTVYLQTIPADKRIRWEDIKGIE